jgi:NAD(P)-dependent dehydrogenase (short-subunit alcohol dehydrogenase family)
LHYPGKKKKKLTNNYNRGLGAQIAHAFAAEGANIAINYASNENAATALASDLAAKYPGTKTTTIKADAGGSSSELATLVKTTLADLGGLDILIANAGWTRFSRFADLDALSDAEWDRCWRTNVLGVKSLIASAMPVFEGNAEGGVVLVTSSIAGRTIGGSSMAYSVTKAAQLHLVKCVAKTQGSKVRCNAVLPGLLLTEWGLEYGEERIEELRRAAVLKREVRVYPHK